MNILSETKFQCFCNIPAYKTFTLELGPILECGRLDPSSSLKEDSKRKFTCGFHVHETSWIDFHRDYQNHKTMPTKTPEHEACTTYNLTYCCTFHIENDLIKEPLTILPNCFCNSPAVLSDSDLMYSLRFVCQNMPKKNCSVILSRSPYCLWNLDYKQAVFPRPAVLSHTVIDLHTYLQRVNTPPATGSHQHRNNLSACIDQQDTSTVNSLVGRDSNQQQQSSSKAIVSSSTNTPSNILLGQQDLLEQSNVCRLCCIHQIENSVSPCFHYVYCDGCAKKKKLCMICNQQITGIYKVFSC